MIEHFDFCVSMIRCGVQFFQLRRVEKAGSRYFLLFDLRRPEDSHARLLLLLFMCKGGKDGRRFLWSDHLTDVLCWIKLLVSPSLIATVLKVLRFLRRRHSLISPIKDNATLSHISLGDGRSLIISRALEQPDPELFIASTVILT